MQALILTGNINHPDICWEDKKKSRYVLGTSKCCRDKAMLFVLTNRVIVVNDITESSLDHSNHTII